MGLKKEFLEFLGMIILFLRALEILQDRVTGELFLLKVITVKAKSRMDSCRTRKFDKGKIVCELLIFQVKIIYSKFVIKKLSKII